MYIILVGMRLDEHLEEAGVDPQFRVFPVTLMKFLPISWIQLVD
jgi:hypothetical protein